ncbi:MAG: ABC transporter substrate-binding protein [Moraxellaceae bacterium]|nr:ABC transporter substrate-binding protein [Moraxellaceae bacterium]
MRTFLLALMLMAGSGMAAEVTDDIGHRLALSLPVQRMVVLAPHATDMLQSIGAGQQIVAVVDDHETRGAHARSLSGYPVVADAFALNEERLLALRPDLVVVWGDGTPATQQARLSRLGLPVYTLQARALTDLPRQLRVLGELTGQEAGAELAALAAEQQLQRLAAYGKRPAPRLRYFYEVWSQPLYSLQGDHLLSQALALCGADNILPPGPVAAPMVNPEFVVQANPDVLIHGKNSTSAVRARWSRFPRLTAVQKQQWLAVDDPRLARPGPGLLQAAEPLCAQLAQWRIRSGEAVSDKRTDKRLKAR